MGAELAKINRVKQELRDQGYDGILITSAFEGTPFELGLLFNKQDKEYIYVTYSFKGAKDGIFIGIDDKYADEIMSAIEVTTDIAPSQLAIYLFAWLREDGTLQNVPTIRKEHIMLVMDHHEKVTGHQPVLHLDSNPEGTSIGNKVEGIQ